jgi:hypothetical protein
MKYKDHFKNDLDKALHLHEFMEVFMADKLENESPSYLKISLEIYGNIIIPLSFDN